MYRYLILLIILAGLAGFVPDLFGPGGHSGKHPAAAGRIEGTRPSLARATAEPLSEPSYFGNGRVAKIEPNTEGHFIGQFRVNGHGVSGMIDTGATYVAMNSSTARELGITPALNAYKYAVTTANGMTNAAHAMLANVEIGQIRVSNVDAFVLPDSAMTNTLIGMSFLKKLSSYEVNHGVLDLKQ